MFDSDFVDLFSRCPFWVVPILYVPGVLALLLRLVFPPAASIPLY